MEAKNALENRVKHATGKSIKKAIRKKWIKQFCTGCKKVKNAIGKEEEKIINVKKKERKKESKEGFKKESR